MSLEDRLQGIGQVDVPRVEVERIGSSTTDLKSPPNTVPVGRRRAEIDTGEGVPKQVDPETAPFDALCSEFRRPSPGNQRSPKHASDGSKNSLTIHQRSSQPLSPRAFADCAGDGFHVLYPLTRFAVERCTCESSLRHVPAHQTAIASSSADGDWGARCFRTPYRSDGLSAKPAAASQGLPFSLSCLLARRRHRIEHDVHSASAHIRTAAVVVLRNPATGRIGNVSSYVDRVDCVFAVDDTPEPDPALPEFGLRGHQHYPPIRCESLHPNRKAPA